MSDLNFVIYSYRQGFVGSRLLLMTKSLSAKLDCTKYKWVTMITREEFFLLAGQKNKNSLRSPKPELERSQILR